MHRHFRDLRRNRHPNIFLQRDFNKSGTEHFSTQILEISCIENLELREQDWLNLFYDNQRSCYNLRKAVSDRWTGIPVVMKIKKDQRKPVHGYNIATQEIKEFNGIREASRACNIPNEAIVSMCKNRIQKCNGWVFAYRDNTLLLPTYTRKERANKY